MKPCSFCSQTTEGTTDFSMEGARNVGSELERIHIAEKNKQMADMLKVIWTSAAFRSVRSDLGLALLFCIVPDN